MAELIPITDINQQEVKIGDVYELHFDIKNIFQVIAGWFAPQWSEEQKKNKINELIQKTLDESQKRGWFRVLKYSTDGNTLILRIGISQIPTQTTVGQLEALPLLLLPFVAEIIVAIGVAIGINVAVSKAFKVVEKPLPLLIMGAVAIAGLYIYTTMRRK